MIRIAYGASAHPTILLIGAHSDDIEVGCAGTLQWLAKSLSGARIHHIVLSCEGVRRQEAQCSAQTLLEPFAEYHAHLEDFRGSFFPVQYEALKQRFEQFKVFAPDLIFTHARSDLHQDHRIVNELTWSTFRSSTIFEYEIPKYDGDLGNPNVYVPMTSDMLRTKCAHLMTHFSSQAHRRWFTPETFTALARLRGIECQAPEGYAEAFHGRKVMLAADVPLGGKAA
jgi:LmbE family N-acetylglucosaminyl deacetylase